MVLREIAAAARSRGAESLAVLLEEAVDVPGKGS